MKHSVIKEEPVEYSTERYKGPEIEDMDIYSKSLIMFTSCFRFTPRKQRNGPPRRARTLKDRVANEHIESKKASAEKVGERRK